MLVEPIMFWKVVFSNVKDEGIEKGIKVEALS